MNLRAAFGGGGGLDVFDTKSDRNDRREEKNSKKDKKKKKKKKSGGGGGGFFSGIVNAAEDAGRAAGDAATGTVDAAGDAADAAADAGRAAGDAANDAADAAADASDDAGAASWEFAGDVTGYNAMKENGELGRLQREHRNADTLGKLDTGFKFAQNIVLDNPNASVQEALKEVAKKPTEIAQGREISDEELAQSTKRASDRLGRLIGAPGRGFHEATKGTAVDNAATDAVAGAGEFAYDAFIADPTSSAVKLASGIDSETGNDDADTGALEAFDVGVTLATLGTGKAASTAVTKGGKAASKMGKFGALIGLSDEAAGVGAKYADDLAGAFKYGDEAAAATDDLAGGLDEFAQGSDDAASKVSNGLDVFNTGSMTDDLVTLSEDSYSFADDVPGATDDAVREAVEQAEEGSSLADEAFNLSDEGASATDDAAESGDGVFKSFFSKSDEGASVVDDAASTSDEAAGLTDDAATLSDEAAGAADETPSLAKRATDAFFGSTVGKAATAGAGIVVAGTGITAISNGLNQPVQMADGTVLSPTKQYDGTDRFPNGGTLVKISKDGSKQGYTVVLGRQGVNLIVLDGSGEPVKARISAEQYRSLVRNGGAA